MSNSQASDECIRGVLGAVVWSDSRSDFVIARLRTFEGPVWVVKGALGGLNEGESVALSGHFVDDPRWGRQFRVRSARPELPTSAAAIEFYLAKAAVPGVGPKLASRIVREFGESTLEVLSQDPERLQQVPGLGARKLSKIIEVLGPRLEQEKHWVALYGLPLSPKLLAAALKRWKGDTSRILQRQPYRVMELRGAGFVTADHLAKHLGIDGAAKPRIDAGIQYVLEQAASQGHTAPSADSIVGRSADLLDLPAELIETRLAERLHAGAVRSHRIEGQEYLAAADIYDDARRFAEVICRLTESEVCVLEAHQIDRRIDLANEALGFELAGGQRRAIEDALRHKVMVVTGGPGTGKTTLIQGLLAALTPDGLDVALAAPTGRAARRLAEATGAEASTLHRLLEVDPFTRSFQRDRTRPIEADLVIVDECSMLDISIAKSLADALPPDCRLVLVGDVDQLPSVGPGAVLHDLIASQKLCVTRLDEIHRQASQSSIVRNAHLILAGRSPQSDLRDSGGDFFIIPRVDPAQIIETVVQVVQDRLPSRFGFDPLRDVQVLVPTHRGSLGTETLNEALMQALVSDRSPARFGFRVGDKVIQLRNNYDLDIFNGDVGHIQRLLDEGLMVQFGQRLLTIPAEQSGDLKRAYAITVHKSQGSEYPAVVLVLHGQHHLMLQQNLIYTALTRARRFCVIVGDPVAVQRAVGRQSSTRRQTLLKHFLLEESQL